jgi:aminoglycoside phosphotransferase (APT) family kinase protein
MSLAATTTPSISVSDLAARLEARLAEIGFADTALDGLTRLSGGASLETWLCTVRRPDGPAKLILRREPPNEPRPGLMAREATALAAAGRNGVPSPRLLDWSSEPEQLGAAYLLVTHVPGETIPRKILREHSLAGARERLVDDLGRAAARIHQIPREEVADVPAADGVSLMWQRYLGAGLPRPVFELAFQWLEQHRPAPVPGALVHGDFRLGNVIVDESGLAAVLDWELVHWGDPMEDLGYLTIRAWRFGGTHPVAGVGSFGQLFDSYADAGGAVPDPERVRWWQVAGTLNWGVSCIVQANRHFQGDRRSVELAAIGRRVAEQEHDLLRMIAAEDA